MILRCIYIYIYLDTHACSYLYTKWESGGLNPQVGFAVREMQKLRVKVGRGPGCIYKPVIYIYIYTHIYLFIYVFIQLLIYVTISIMTLNFDLFIVLGFWV